jgi:hypothetical protein
MNFKRYIYFGLVLLAIALTGCQGRLNLVLKNNAGIDLFVVSDGKIISVPAGDEVRLGSPIDQSLFLKTKSEAYEFHIPFPPRPYSLNAYIDSHLVTKGQINSLTEIVIFPVEHQTPPIELKGKHLSGI